MDLKRTGAKLLVVKKGLRSSRSRSLRSSGKVKSLKGETNEKSKAQSTVHENALAAAANMIKSIDLSKLKTLTQVKMAKEPRSRGMVTCSTVVPLRLQPLTARMQRDLFRRRVYSALVQLVGFTYVMMLFLTFFSESINWIGLLAAIVCSCMEAVIVSLIAYYIKYDLTILFCWQFLFGSFALLFMQMVIYLAIDSWVMHHIFLGMVNIGAGILLIISTQMVLSDDGDGPGAHKRHFPNEEYFRAALALYLEIVLLFFYIPGVHVFPQSLLLE